MCHVHEKRLRILYRMPGVGRMLLRRIVLEIDAGQATLRFRENLVLVLCVVFALLEHDAVE